MTRAAIKATVLAAMIGASSGAALARRLSSRIRSPWSMTVRSRRTSRARSIFTRSRTSSTAWISPPTFTPRRTTIRQKKYPAIVVAHPNGGVKEQVAGLYAQRLAEQGYITITADAAYQGASGGQPRNVDKPAYRIEDIHGMADFITRYPGVDVARLGLLGICGGGGYSLAAAKTDKRFKSIATLSMFNSGRVRRNGYRGFATGHHPATPAAGFGLPAPRKWPAGKFSMREMPI